MSDSYEDQRLRVVERWQDATFTTNLAEVNWMVSQTVKDHLNLRVSGDRSCDWMTYLGTRYIHPRGYRALVLGCGDGWLERSLAQHWFIESIDAMDVAAGAVERAREEAKRQGIEKIRYQVRDLNHERVPAGPYDLVIAHSVIHHIENLEFFFDGLRSALAPDGLLLVNEYVGPKRFQYTERQMRIINRLFTALPERFRRSRLTPVTYECKRRPTVDEMIAEDPSEAVRSDEILDFVSKNFVVLERHGFGGTILCHLLYDVIQNFSETVPAEKSLLEMLCLTEDVLTAHGGLFSDFQALAASRTKLEPVWTRPATPSGGSRLRGRLADASSRLADVVLPQKRVLAPLGAHIRPLREMKNSFLTNDPRADWIDFAIRECGREGLRVLVTGKGKEDVARRIRTHPSVSSVEVASRGAKFDLVLGLGALKGPSGANPIVESIATGGVLVSIERMARGAAPDWLVEFADALVRQMPERWHRAPGLRSRLRRLRAVASRRGADLNAIRRSLAPLMTSIEFHPMSSQLSEFLLSECTPPEDPADGGETALLGVFTAIEQLLLEEGMADPSIGLLVAHRS